MTSNIDQKSMNSGTVTTGKSPCYKNRKVLEAVNSDSTQNLTKVVTPMKVENLKVPTSFGEVPFMLQRLYIKYLDCKAQTVEGIFKNQWNRKWSPGQRQYYRRAINKLLESGWARPVAGGEDGDIAVRAYQHVWRDLGIKRFIKKDRKRFRDARLGSGEFYSYFKIPIRDLAEDRKVYNMQITDTIQKHVAERKRAQIRQRLNSSSSSKIDKATFGAKRAALLFGYKSPSTGSKLRKKNFSIVETDEKPSFNRRNGRWENPCKQIAL